MVGRPKKELLAFYDYSAEQWMHIRSANVIEPAFGTISHRTNRTKGCVARQMMLAFANKLGMCTQSWTTVCLNPPRDEG